MLGFAVLVRLRCAVLVVSPVAGAWCCGAPLCVVLFRLVFCGAVLGLVARGCLLVSLSGRLVCFPVVGAVCCGALLPCVVFCGAVLSRGAVLLCSAVVLRCYLCFLCPPLACLPVLRCAVLCCYLSVAVFARWWRLCAVVPFPFLPLLALLCCPCFLLLLEPMQDLLKYFFGF